MPVSGNRCRKRKIDRPPKRAGWGDPSWGRNAAIPVRFCIKPLHAFATATTLFALTTAPAFAGEKARETPLSMVGALHTAFGDHHARAVHTKGIAFEGTFTPTKDARAIVREPIFAGGSLPVVA